MPDTRIPYTHIPDQVFSQPDGTALMLDVHRPLGDENLPAVLYVHGGGWGRGDRTMDVERRVLPLVEAGFVVATLDYRLVPDYHYPSPVNDVIAAGEFLRAQSEKFGIDADAIGVWGSSAGASLSTLAALRHPNLFRAIVHYCGFTDFVASASRSPMEAFLLENPIEFAYLGGEGVDYLQRAADASPISVVGPGAPRSLIVHGDRDRMAPIGDADALHERLSRAGSESTLMTVAGAGHDDPRFDGALVRGATTAFLSAALRG